MTVRRWLVTLATVAFVFADSRHGLAYLELGTDINGSNVVLKWTTTPVRYFVTNGDVPGVSATDLQAALGRDFAKWQAVPTASITYTFGGYTDALPGQDDGMSTIGFVDRPDLDGVLASTSYLVDAANGTLLESDIFFNASYPWSVAAAGEADRYDLESIALHEIGHLSGLGHSALGETELVADGRQVIATDAVMFPIAFPPGTLNRTLHDDDIAGLSDLYPDAGFKNNTGSISGLVLQNGQGVYGAHIVAFDPASGAMVGNFSLDSNGRFVVAGLSPGPHVVRVEPIDDADTSSFLDGDVDIDFLVGFFNRLVVVPRGGDSGTIEISVTGK